MKKTFVLLLYITISLVVTYPLITNPAGILMGWPLDAYNYLWNIDTFWKQIFSLQNPLFTDRIFYPLGVNLIFHTYAPLVSVLGLPFLKNLAVYLNLLIILGTSFSAFFTYNLVKHLTQKNTVSILSGAIYGFAPIMSSFLVSQHLYYIFAAPFVPLGILSLVKFFESEKIKNLLLVGVWFLCIFAIDYYTAVLFILGTLFFTLGFLLTNWERFSHLVKTNVRVFLFILLGVATILTFLSNQEVFQNKSYYPQICSASPTRLIIPSEFNPILVNIAKSLENKFSVSKNYDTPSIFLGFFVPLIALVGIFTVKPQKSVPILFFGSGLLLFSLGPQTKFFEILSKIPPLGLIDCPQRFILGVQLAIAILFGFTLSKINGKKSCGKMLVILAAAIVVFEYFSFNLPYSLIDVPQIYINLSKSQTDKTVLEIPSGVAESKGAFGYDWSIQGLLTKQMYWQTIYQKPRIGGYISRLDTTYYEYFKNEPVISDLFEMSSLNGQWNNKTFSKQQITDFVEKFNLGYIILSPNQRQKLFSQVIENIFEEKISQKYEAQGYVIYYLN